uniref:Uncharacterized protein LOC100368749 n=1 Tax=Saccoglossus kowalevskii TaxID=10224 RepID=A0ABM0GWI5_SACKO|nr:PREDICTED: uncharacterized protein LOC100368749 [Saccoglossus kowalevskii]
MSTTHTYFQTTQQCSHINLFVVVSFIFLSSPWTTHEVAGTLCSNTCETAGNGACEDGGMTWSDTNGCFWGTDCTDCGERTWPYAHDGSSLCDNTCDQPSGETASNGVCEDGGIDAASGACFLGSDCDDCGVRYAPTTTVKPTTVESAETIDSGNGNGNGNGNGDGNGEEDGNGNEDGTTEAIESSASTSTIGQNNQSNDGRSSIQTPIIAGSLAGLIGLGGVPVIAYMYYRYKKRTTVKPDNKIYAAPVPSHNGTVRKLVDEFMNSRIFKRDVVTPVLPTESPDGTEETGIEGGSIGNSSYDSSYSYSYVYEYVYHVVDKEPPLYLSYDDGDSGRESASTTRAKYLVMTFGNFTSEVLIGLIVLTCIVLLVLLAIISMWFVRHCQYTKIATIHGKLDDTEEPKSDSKTEGDYYIDAKMTAHRPSLAPPVLDSDHSPVDDKDLDKRIAAVMVNNFVSVPDTSPGKDASTVKTNSQTLTTSNEESGRTSTEKGNKRKGKKDKKYVVDENATKSEDQEGKPNSVPGIVESSDKVGTTPSNSQIAMAHKNKDNGDDTNQTKSPTHSSDTDSNVVKDKQSKKKKKSGKEAKVHTQIVHLGKDFTKEDITDTSTRNANEMQTDQGKNVVVNANRSKSCDLPVDNTAETNMTIRPGTSGDQASEQESGYSVPSNLKGSAWHNNEAGNQTHENSTSCDLAGHVMGGVPAVTNSSEAFQTGSNASSQLRAIDDTSSPVNNKSVDVTDENPRLIVSNEKTTDSHHLGNGVIEKSLTIGKDGKRNGDDNVGGGGTHDADGTTSTQSTKKSKSSNKKTKQKKQGTKAKKKLKRAMSKTLLQTKLN